MIVQDADTGEEVMNEVFDVFNWNQQNHLIDVGTVGCMNTGMVSRGVSITIRAFSENKNFEKEYQEEIERLRGER